MDYVILSTLSGLVALLFCGLLSIRPTRKELEECKSKIQVLEKEKMKLDSDLMEARSICCLLKLMNEVDDEKLEEMGKENKSLRQQNEELRKELLEQVDNQTEGSDGKA
ncbi:hypothetical protein [Porphyromonas sp.]